MTRAGQPSVSGGEGERGGAAAQHPLQLCRAGAACVGARARDAVPARDARAVPGGDAALDPPVAVRRVDRAARAHDAAGVRDPVRRPVDGLSLTAGGSERLVRRAWVRARGGW